MNNKKVFHGVPIELNKRKQLRLSDYDYSQEGFYFLTLCAKDRMNIFGKVKDLDDPLYMSKMEYNEIGEVISNCWVKINELYDNVTIDVFTLMPNHFHGIIVISEKVGQRCPSLQKIIQGFKSITTRNCFNYGYTHIWQRGYYEHIIRGEKELDEIRDYILNNPTKWKNDEYFS